jgi:hypothetical protein
MEVTSASSMPAFTASCQRHTTLRERCAPTAARLGNWRIHRANERQLSVSAAQHSAPRRQAVSACSLSAWRPISR